MVCCVMLYGLECCWFFGVLVCLCVVLLFRNVFERSFVRSWVMLCVVCVFVCV